VRLLGGEFVALRPFLCGVSITQNTKIMDDTQVAAPSAALISLDPQAERLILAVLSQHADALLGTARRNSLCLDDAHDAYQRGMEIFTKRAGSLTRDGAAPWLHAVIRNEARAVRKARLQLVGADDAELDRRSVAMTSSPEELAIGSDRTARAAEALKRLKPDELRAIWLRALGLSYAEISTETGWTATKVNRCLAEGRRTFLARYAGIESGDECRRWAPLLSAIVDGEATSEQLLEVRPHTRNCPACRATLRELSEADSALRVVLPVGVIAIVGRAAGLVDRLLPAAAGTDAALAAGGFGSAAAAATKVAAVLVVATASITVAGNGRQQPAVAAAQVARPATAAQPPRAAPSAPPSATAHVATTVSATQASTQAPSATARREATAAREFVPPRTATPPPAAPTPQSHEFTP